MKLSVILPCYNGAETITTQLEALATQRWKGEWELIVVNNGSTDHSMEIVESYRDRFPSMQIVHAHSPSEPRRGVSYSYNTGIEATTGDALAFCEADDEVTPNWLGVMANALSRYDAVGGPLDHQQLNPAWVVDVFGAGGQLEELKLAEYLVPLPYTAGCNFGMKRSVYEAVGKLDESIRYGWDTDYCWRIQQAGFQLQFIPELVIHYRLRHSLSEMYRQSYHWSVDHMLLIRLYCCPIGKLDLVKTTLNTLRHSLKGATISNKVALAKWLYELAWMNGRAIGYVKYFVLKGFDQQRHQFVRQVLTKTLCFTGLIAGGDLLSQEMQIPEPETAFLQRVNRLIDS